MGHLGRRRFLALSGTVILGWRVPAWAASRVLPGFGAEKSGHPVGLWVVIAEDNTTTIRIARSEMGQGTLTGLAQLVADELDADWATVRAEYVPPERNLLEHHAWGDMSTGGSRGIRSSVQYVREGGAAARAMLIEAAARRWGVPAAECSAADSTVRHAASDRSLRYGELAADAAKLPVPAKPVLKPESAWKLIGQPLPRLDTAEKLDGSARYAIDVVVPGMKLAAIAQCPVFGGKLAGFDATAVTGIKGVRHVLAVGDDAVAVVADTWYIAKTALAKLPITWNEGANAAVDSAAIARRMAEGLDAADATAGLKQGDPEAAFAGAARVIEATYTTGFQNHATLEPQNCTAHVTDEGVEIWVGSQNGDASLAAAAEAGGVPLGRVTVNKYLLGGGFGRRGQQDYVRQAVLIAKQLPGVPIKLIWSREEDMQHGYYRPATQCKLRGALDDRGNLVALHLRLSGQSILAYLLPNREGFDPLPFQGLLADEIGYLAVPNLLIDYAMRNSHVPVGFWRGVNNNQNAVYHDCFIDELAHAAGRDPLEFRRAALAKNPKHLAVLNAVAEKAGWGTSLPPGRFRGIAQNCGFGSYTAAVAEVSVSDKGELTIHKITAATDPGHVVNPDQVRAQVEGSFVYGLSAALSTEITIARGRVEQSNFDNYPVMRLDKMPAVETVLAPSGGFWGGVGEPTIAVAAPAVLNAIFAATGKRIRNLPLGSQDLRKT